MKVDERLEVDASAADVAGYLRSNGVRVVEAWTPDIHGIARGKRFPAGEFAEVVALAGLHLADAILCWGRDCNLFEDVTFSNSETGYPDLTARPDLSTLRAMPWRPGHAAVLCHLTTLDGSLVEADPRQVLTGQLDALAERGLSARCGVEYEFYLLTEDRQQAMMKRDCYAFALAEDVETFLQEVATLEDFGLPVEAVETEWGTAQIEVTLNSAPALLAADQAVLFKSAVKALARARGLVATFIPKFIPEEPGSGLHVNQSLWDADGANVFSSDQGLEGTLARYLGGLLKTAAEFFLLGAPTVNAYKRRVPGAFAPTTVNWSRGSRTSAIRAMFDRGSRESRIEYRMPGADANPYLAFAASLAGGLHGIEQGASVPAELEGNSYEREDQYPALPNTLLEAINRFTTSPVAKARFGERFVNHYASIVRHDAWEYAAAVTDWELDRYLVHA